MLHHDPFGIASLYITSCAKLEKSLTHTYKYIYIFIFILILNFQIYYLQSAYELSGRRSITHNDHISHAAHVNGSTL